MKWIPCEERLPNDNREVLISLEWGIDIGTYERGEWRSEWINHYDDDNVLAWMPLPQPYTANRKTEPTISKMEQVDKDINVRSKDEPQTCEECEHWNDTEDDCADRHDCKTEPQIDGAIDEARFKAHCMNCQRDVADIKCLDCDGDKYFIPDEPQTDCSWR